jgi:hypothetical protein
MENKNLFDTGVTISPYTLTTASTSYEPFKINSELLAFVRMPRIKKVIFQKTHTIVTWQDGSKSTVVNCCEEKFDKEKGLAMAIAKKIMPRNEFKRLIDNATIQDK